MNLVVRVEENDYTEVFGFPLTFGINVWGWDRSLLDFGVGVDICLVFGFRSNLTWYSVLSNSPVVMCGGSRYFCFVSQSDITCLQFWNALNCSCGLQKFTACSCRGVGIGSGMKRCASL